MNKTLIAFFSHKGETYFPQGYKNVEIGNAQIIAQKAQKILNAEIFEIDTKRTYSKSYEECCNEAKIELQKGEFPELKNDINTDGFDNIVLVYPCWWGTMPRGVFTFLNNHNLENKNIFPICTHEGSGMGSSESDLKRACKGAEFSKGLPIKGSRASSSDSEIENWLRENELL